MEAVARQRCWNHALREAAARCPECGHFFCRECITEHDDRIICANCLKKIGAPVEHAARRRWNVWPLAQALGGVLGAWVLFYLCALGLLSVPDEFHEADVWKEKLGDILQVQGFDE